MVARSGKGRTGGTRRLSARWLAAGALAWLVSAPGAALAIRFGQNDAVEFRGKLYTQYTVATEDSRSTRSRPSIRAT